MSNLKSVREKMLGEWSHLQRQWQITVAQWNDAVRHRFEREFMQDYEPSLTAVLKGLERLDQVIAQAMREVK